MPYLSIEQTSEEDLANPEKRQVRFILSNDIVIEKRTRYNVWDLLDGVGGFNNGLILV